jgi:nicotinamidase-related amidase
LQVLLPSLGATRLVLVGLAADLCLLFTAADAHMRSYDLWTPRDGLVPSHPARLEPALEILSDGLGADTRPAACLDAKFWTSDASAGA